MMDETTIEQLSRYLDGDLTPGEGEALAARIESDPTMRARLDSMRALREQLRSAALREDAPADLDRLIEPLLQARPPSAATRPWAKWLATAAVMVLGVTVILEVQRGSGRPVAPEAPSRSRPAPANQPTERFSLAPLPTSSVPVDEQPIGVTDRLLASPIPEIEIDDPPALDVIGPLSSPPAEGAAEPTGRRQPAAMAGKSTLEKEDARVTEKAPLRNEESDLDSAATRVEPREENGKALRAAPAPGWGDRAPLIEAKLFVFIGDRTEWLPFAPKTRCKTGRYAVRVRVDDGRVVEVWPMGAATSPTPQERLCAAELIAGLDIERVPDGEHRAEVLLERQQNQR